MRKLLTSDEDSLQPSKKFLKDLQFILDNADPNTIPFQWATLHRVLAEEGALLYPKAEKIALKYMNVIMEDPENSEELCELMNKEIMDVAQTLVDNRLRAT